MKSKVSLILRLGISAGLVTFLLWSMRTQFAHIANTLATTNFIIFSLAAILFMLTVVILSLRLNLLFIGEGFNIPLGRVIQLSFIGYFFNNFMPTAVGGDIVKAYYAHKQTNQTAKSFISVFMDRFIGLFSFICIATITLFLSWENINIVLRKIVLTFAFFGILGFFIILNSRVAKVILKALSKFKLWNIGERLSKAYRTVHEYRNKKRLLLLVMGISVISQSIYFSTIYLLARALGANLLLATVFLVMPIVSVVSMLPSLGGLGLREGAMVALFGPIIGNDSAFSVSILLLAILLIISLLGAVIYASASQFRLKPRELDKLESSM